MSDPDFDTALVTAAFRIAADQGWRSVSVVAASRAAGLPVDEARARFLDRSSILLRFGRLADQAALKDAPSEGAIRDRLFLAMAQLRLGRAAESERTFDEATRRTDGQGADDHPCSWPDRVEYEVLRREAEAPILGARRNGADRPGK